MVKATVAAVITPSAAQPRTILLTQRSVNPFNGFWCLPGGHIDEGERAEQAVIREVAEETGLDFRSPRFIGYCDEIFPDYRFHAEVLIFAGTGLGTPKPEPEEVSDIEWFSLDEARDLDLAFNHHTVLDQYERHLESL
ncbi:NUDIX hydrolase [Prosthecochloris sp. N3]|uniref:NUDIX hydrolase n=1 Tax=Prosthecochloris ethylica TaxID=2743976 RepID=A0ABR9XS56_9CHLB|nr:NUDIX hydrolase [Prosthecochloris ethylica]MBF0585349.1 NUDIX hydrolase [Prosthecochloris ethylica]MBF0636885.1 NUDIX hydrolase [Prosthecochloris ethylica]NUK46578.1 NUDIX hydrolase [Prosthecochloris ethylica]